MLKAIFLDLDNTLYPASSGMEDRIIERMIEYVAEVCGTSIDEAARLRSQLMPNYGTTLEWLMADYGFSDIDGYFAAVHPEHELEDLEEDSELRPFLDSIPLPKFIFTNSPMEHAERVMDFLDITECFDAIYDVKFNKLRGKPDRSAVERVLEASGFKAEETIFADDQPRYVKGFTDCGGKGVLVDYHDRHRDSGFNRIRTIYELKRYL